MKVTVELVTDAKEPPPPGALVRVQARDTSLEDAPARVLVESRAKVEKLKGESLARVTLAFDPEGRTTIWAHVDLNGDGKISKGDFVSTQSYPVTPDLHGPLRINLRRV